MDAKASARTKHALSQRGRARHSTRKRQPQVSQQQQATSPQEKKDLQLPSNWSRYDEEEDKEEEEDNHSDVPLVKSKGANYKDLLAEKSILQGSDLASGRKALMVARGLDLWSQFTNMDSIWSIGEVSSEEDNFFTLDLDFLNKELSKLDITRRLLLDAEYACLGEIEKSERVNRFPKAETIDADNAILALPSSSSIMSEAGLQDFDGLNRSALTGNEEPRGTSIFGTKLLERPVATAKQTEDHIKSFPNKESEIPDFGTYSISKEPMSQLTTAANLFDAKFAEAELDVLLDMLDQKSARQAPLSIPIESFGLARGPASTFPQAPDALQESCSLHFRVDSPDVAPFVGAPNDSPFHVVESTNSAVALSSALLKVPDVDTKKSVPNLDEDFDAWLDSL